MSSQTLWVRRKLQEPSASSFSGLTSRSTISRIPRTNNTLLQTRRWPRSLGQTESEHLVWPSSSRSIFPIKYRKLPKISMRESEDKNLKINTNCTLSFCILMHDYFCRCPIP
uniref:Uncharacterized protein n=1 Tax=Lepeophtheirus salmonis TaxID=72036 RepID=A0A0K2UUJ7_LEPSM